MMHVRSKKTIDRGVPTVVGMLSESRPTAGGEEILAELGSVADTVFDAVGFEGKVGQTAVVTTEARTAVFVGLGDEVDLEGLRVAAGHARGAVPKATTIATTLHTSDVDGALNAVIEGFGFADYVYEPYLSEPKNREELTLQLLDAPKGWKQVAADAAIIIDAVALARDLVNTPPRDKAPLDLAHRVVDIADDKIFCVFVADDEETVREHARRAGIPCDVMHRVAAVIDPATGE